MTDDTLAAVGEIAALGRIIPRLTPPDAAEVGAGDDAAVLAAPDGRVVITTDSMVDGPDFRLAWSSPFELGWKAAATNLADIAAMGAVPTALVVALMAPPSTPVALLEGVADGLAAACTALAPGCGVVGGDLASSPTLTIAVTAIGALEGRSPVLRSRARAGDVLAYAGVLGLAAGALRMLFSLAVDAAGAADAARASALRGTHADLLAEQLAPRPPIAAGVIAALAGATAMLDVSDGLLLDAGRIAKASGVVLDLSRGALEPDAAAVVAATGFAEDVAWDLVLAGGEDHGLLATFPSAADVPAGFRVVGRVLAGDATVLLGGKPPSTRTLGWDSFA
jgi:thiamine-monophosphate kinase